MKTRECGEVHTDAMNVFVHAVVIDVWAVVVDDMHDITDVKPSSRDTGGDHDGRLAGAECTPGDGQQGW